MKTSILNISNKSGINLTTNSSTLLYHNGNVIPSIPSNASVPTALGSGTQPIYIVDGQFVATTYALNAGISAGLASRMAYYSDSTTISAATHFVNNTRVAINSVDTPSTNFLVQGTTLLNGQVDVGSNLYPTANNTYTLGMAGSDDALRWKSLFIGTADSYGDECTPIYWNNGVPKTVGVIQYCDFSFASGATTVVLNKSSYTANTYVIQIVVNSGEANLNGVISWESAAGKVTLNTPQTSGVVSGYILTARGVAL